MQTAAFLRPSAAHRGRDYIPNINTTHSSVGRKAQSSSLRCFSIPEMCRNIKAS